MDGVKHGKAAKKRSNWQGTTAWKKDSQREVQREKNNIKLVEKDEVLRGAEETMCNHTSELFFLSEIVRDM